MGTVGRGIYLDALLVDNGLVEGNIDGVSSGHEVVVVDDLKREGLSFVKESVAVAREVTSRHPLLSKRNRTSPGFSIFYDSTNQA